MPNGYVHNRFTIILGVLTIPASLLFVDPQTAMWYGAGVALGIIMTPDLDQAEIHSVTPQQMVGNALGEFAENIYRVIWFPYGLFISHRSWVSHFPVVGTAIRLLYLYVLYWCACWTLRIEPIPLQVPIPLVVGLVIADTQHFILDQLPFFRGEKKQRKKG